MKNSDDFSKGKRGAVIQATPAEKETILSKARLSKWDVIDQLHSEEDIACYLEAIKAENDPALMEIALADAALARSKWGGAD